MDLTFPAIFHIPDSVLQAIQGDFHEKLSHLLVCGISLAFLSPIAQSATVDIHWNDISKFTDVRVTNETAVEGRARVIKEFENIIKHAADKLGENYHFDITITDVDLAGVVRPVFGSNVNEIRVIKGTDWPRINFDYVLKDGEKEVASGKISLRDMGFQYRSNFGNSEFKYEEQLWKDWFRAVTQENHLAKADKTP